VLPLEEAWL